ncbi:hypothetical protein BV20DRAFT_938165 [Pilatotrama ljubarskyi]|nr:hypothetical protein BV20DRAFT_954471 [Pilatotrama ljubarskyi]KAI0373098.1 hypothetical protein BV20DRAFT_938165 [Pilatotrama ljubarskyi]
MGNRRHIPDEQKELILTMLAHLSPKKIADVTGISARTIRRVRQTYRETGQVSRKPLVNGRPRELTGVEYLESLIERQPDLMLSELRDQLEAAYGIEVDVTTISRSLHRRGYTHKKAGKFLLIFACLHSHHATACIGDSTSIGTQRGIAVCLHGKGSRGIPT